MNRTITKNAIDSVNRFTFLRLNRMLNHFSAFLRLRTGDLDVFERIVKSGQELKLGLLSKTSFSWLFERKKKFEAKISLGAWVIGIAHAIRFDVRFVSRFFNIHSVIRSENVGNSISSCQSLRARFLAWMFKSCRLYVNVKCRSFAVNFRVILNRAARLQSLK